MKLIDALNSAAKEATWFKKNKATITNREFKISLSLDAINNGRWAVSTEVKNKKLASAIMSLVKHLKPGDVIDQDGKKWTKHYFKGTIRRGNDKKGL